MTLKELNVTVRKKFEDDGPYKYLWQTSEIIEQTDAFELHTVALPKFLSSISFSTILTFVGFHPLKLLNSSQIINEKPISSIIPAFYKISNLSSAIKLQLENDAKIFFIEDEFT